MAFRKRNIVVGQTHGPASPGQSSTVAAGVRPSPLTSHPVTSTGTPSLDDLLGGHAGLALGSSLLIEESGTTDFAGALLRFYAAEGLCQGHVLHVVGVGEVWSRDLPGVAEDKHGLKLKPSSSNDEDKMKIAWRYERLGQAGERALPDRGASTQSSEVIQQPFCHIFDLTKRLSPPADAKIHHIPVRNAQKPFEGVIPSLEQALKSSPQSVHRVVIPSVLSPAVWPLLASGPAQFLRFLHSLRSILSQHPSRLTVMMTLPLELFPRSSGLVRWAELLSDGVLELTPFPHLMDASNGGADTGPSKASEEQPQGMLRVHKLPINTERGEGGAGANNSMGDDLAFTVSRRKFTIQPFSLPPLEGDHDAQKDAGKITSKEVEF